MWAQVASPTPVAITWHGLTVGFYVPARGTSDERVLLALKQAVAQLENLMAEHGITENEVVHEFRARRAQH